MCSLSQVSAVASPLFSSFADDIWKLGNAGDWMTSLVYFLATVILGVLLVWGGRALIR